MLVVVVVVVVVGVWPRNQAGDWYRPPQVAVRAKAVVHALAQAGVVRKELLAPHPRHKRGVQTAHVAAAHKKHALATERAHLPGTTRSPTLDAHLTQVQGLEDPEVSIRRLIVPQLAFSSYQTSSLGNGVPRDVVKEQLGHRFCTGTVKIVREDMWYGIWGCSRERARPPN